MGESLVGYHLPDHPLQAHVKRTMARSVDFAEDQVHWAIDGCNLPTPAFALDRLARLYMMKIAAAPEGSALARIYRAMTSHPELVGGEGRFCTLLMKAFRGALVGKTGADANYAIGVRHCGESRGWQHVRAQRGRRPCAGPAGRRHAASTRRPRRVLQSGRANTMGVPTGYLDVRFTLHNHRQ